MAIQRLPKASRPAPAPIPQPSQPANTNAPRPGQPNKRRRNSKAVAGGSTALAALFCFFVFSSPWAPGLQTPTLHHLLMPDHQALTEGGFGGAKTGRVLQALQANGGSFYLTEGVLDQM